jgi:hypothetical protein
MPNFLAHGLLVTVKEKMHLVMFLYLSQSLAIIVMDQLITGPLKREKITDRGWIVTATGVGRRLVCS